MCYKLCIYTLNYIWGLCRKIPAIVNIMRMNGCVTSMYPGSQGEGLKCGCKKNDNFTVLVSGGSRHHWGSMCTVWQSHSKWLREYSNKHASHFKLDWTFLHGNYLDDSETCSYWQLVIGSCIMTMNLLMHHVCCRVFRWNFKSPRWLRTPTAQIWCPATSGFSQN